MDPDQDTKSSLRSNGSMTFLGWIVAEVAGYGALVLQASDRIPATCTGLCFSDREFLLFLGLGFGIAAVPAQIIVGLMMTGYLHRQPMAAPAAGTVAFFTTLALLVAALAYFGLFQVLTV
jgi:hypothetical protein